jgi:hypothetical protein
LTAAGCPRNRFYTHTHTPSPLEYATDFYTAGQNLYSIGHQNCHQNVQKDGKTPTKMKQNSRQKNILLHTKIFVLHNKKIAFTLQK